MSKPLNWNKKQLCVQCGEEMRKQTDKTSTLVAHERHGLCRRCSGKKTTDSRGRKRNSIVFDDKGQVCVYCSQYKPFSSFTKNHECLSGHNSTCKTCKILWIHNLSYTEYIAMLARQDNKCAICKKSFEEFNGPWNIDHNHNCCPRNGKKMCGKCIRGILCGSCNRGIGHFQDNTTTLISAAKYLKGYDE